MDNQANTTPDIPSTPLLPSPAQPYIQENSMIKACKDWKWNDITANTGTFRLEKRVSERIRQLRLATGKIRANIVKEIAADSEEDNIEWNKILTPLAFLRIEENRVRRVPLFIIQKICKYYNITVDKLLSNVPLHPPQLIKSQVLQISENAEIAKLEYLQKKGAKKSLEMLNTPEYKETYKKYILLAKDSPLAQRMIPRIIAIETLLDEAIQKYGCEPIPDLLKQIEALTRVHLSLSDSLKVLPKQKKAGDDDEIREKELSAYDTFQKSTKVLNKKRVDEDREEEELLDRKKDKEEEL